MCTCRKSNDINVTFNSKIYIFITKKIKVIHKWDPYIRKNKQLHQDSKYLEISLYEINNFLNSY